MPKAPITVYDLNMQRVAMLENAYGIGYQMPLNSLWTASFSLPANDPKNAECKPLHYVELFDGEERVELFRIIPNTARRDSSGLTVTYQCEHVLATLLDDILFQYHTVGNIGVHTKDVLQYILSKQIVQRWNLGTVAFDRQFEYTWQNETLLGAVFSVPKPFIEEFQWTWNTEIYPWTLNLIAPAQPENDVNMAYIRYGVNMQGIEKTTDPMSLCTRLYCLGYGEGVNQLTINDVNGGLPYLDADTQGQYGIISRTFVDRRYDNAETLKARGQVLLEELKRPRVTYKVSASEIHRLTGQQIYKFRTGFHVRTKDDEMGEDFIARVVNVSKGDITGAPGDVEIEIANRPEDFAGSIADLQNRQRINDVYAQGATNIDSHDFADNADPLHPAILRFYIPEETARINKLNLSFQCGPFRAYSKAIEAAPATTSSPSSTSTTLDGGQTTSGSSSTSTTANGGEVVATDTNIQISVPGVNPIDTTLAAGTHNHGFNDGDVFVLQDGTWRTFQESGNHFHNLYNHAHEINLQAHTHGMDHTHEIAAHTHGMDHTHEIAAHTHGIEYGIYEGPSPSSVIVEVDGNIVPDQGTNATDVDIIPYLAKDGNGKITRGTWHEIKITPNILGRIVTSVISQIFVQSRGGGSY